MSHLHMWIDKEILYVHIITCEKNQGAEKVCTYNYVYMWKSKVQEKSVYRLLVREFGIDTNP